MTIQFMRLSRLYNVGGHRTSIEASGDATTHPTELVQRIEWMAEALGATHSDTLDDGDEEVTGKPEAAPAAGAPAAPAKRHRRTKAEMQAATNGAPPAAPQTLMPAGVPSIAGPPPAAPQYPAPAGAPPAPPAPPPVAYVPGPPAPPPAPAVQYVAPPAPPPPPAPVAPPAPPAARDPNDLAWEKHVQGHFDRYRASLDPQYHTSVDATFASLIGQHGPSLHVLNSTQLSALDALLTSTFGA